MPRGHRAECLLGGTGQWLRMLRRRTECRKLAEQDHLHPGKTMHEDVEPLAHRRDVFGLCRNGHLNTGDRKRCHKEKGARLELLAEKKGPGSREKAQARLCHFLVYRVESRKSRAWPFYFSARSRIASASANTASGMVSGIRKRITLKWMPQVSSSSPSSNACV